MYDELQFTLGEGPCLDSVTRRAPVLVDRPRRPRRRALARLRPRHAGPAGSAACSRCPSSSPANTSAPSTCSAPSPATSTTTQFAGAIVAAELAGIPLLDLLDADLQAAVADPGSNAWAELHALSRAEVSQATGMLVAQLGVEPAEALVRLRAHAYATGRSATDVARDILDRRLRLEAD